ncbi:sodium/hydrogen exchanger family protein [Mariannaea sp. PMI_226]|nr:sodium/hydrogen exchanger family protein [Mariannaea sp. PMI_226]
MASSVPYHEPSISDILTLSGFLLSLNIANYGLDKVASCGLLAQVVLGIAWGTPGGNLLAVDTERVVVQLGYLGLILLVFEGGLTTSVKSMRANLWLSTCVAVTGIAAPIALSFILQPMLDATRLQAFTAGAALCSTSLGTTLTILDSSRLSSTRLGVILTTAAMIDDVIGLIMVQVVSNLGGREFDPITLIRPILVSIGFATIVPLLCGFLILPLTLRLNSWREKNPTSKIASLFRLQQTAFIIHVSLLLGLVAAGTFAGTSSLLAAYIAGASVSWWDTEVPHVHSRRNPPPEARDVEGTEGVERDNCQPNGASSTPQSVSQNISESDEEDTRLGTEIFARYFKSVLEYILKPFFFASIGFSVPVTRMFSGPVVWRGIIYAILMAAGKLACGFWLMPFTNPLRGVARLVSKSLVPKATPLRRLSPVAPCASTNPPVINQETSQETTGENPEERTDTTAPRVPCTAQNSTQKPEKPRSLYPASIIGLGMVARGEIGFLVASLADSKGIFGLQSSELFLVVIWAITLCTLIGPIFLGLLLNRVRTLESSRGRNGAASHRSVLGAWGLS